MDNLYPVSYAAKPTDPNTPRLHEAMRGPYREGFIDLMGDYIYALHKNQIWSIITR